MEKLLFHKFLVGKDCDIVDLTHSLSEKTLLWPGSVPFRLCMHDYCLKKEEEKSGKNDTFVLHNGEFSCAEHSGTHVDAPFHFTENGKKVGEISIDDLIGPCKVIDVKLKCDGDRDYNLSAEDILDYEARHGGIENGDIVLVRNGWSSRFLLGSKEYYGFDKERDGEYDFEKTVLSFPGISPEAAKVLVKRGIRAVGLDSPSLDSGKNFTFPTHRILLEAGIYGIENINNGIDHLPAKGGYLIVMPVKLTNGSGAPARVVGVIPK